MTNMSTRAEDEVTNTSIVFITFSFLVYHSIVITQMIMIVNSVIQQKVTRVDCHKNGSIKQAQKKMLMRHIDSLCPCTLFKV